MQSEQRTSGAMPTFHKDESGPTARVTRSRSGKEEIELRPSKGGELTEKELSGSYGERHEASRGQFEKNTTLAPASISSKSTHSTVTHDRLPTSAPTASMATVTTVSTSTAVQETPGAEPTLRTVTATTESHTGAVSPDELAIAPQIRGPVLVQTHEEVPGAAPVDTTRVIQRRGSSAKTTVREQLPSEESMAGRVRHYSDMGRHKLAELRSRLERQVRQLHLPRHINPTDFHLSLPVLRKLLPMLLLPMLALGLAVYGYRHMPRLFGRDLATREAVVPFTGLEHETSFEHHGHDIPAHYHADGEFVPHHIDTPEQSVMPPEQPGQQFTAAQQPPVHAHVHIPAHVHTHEHIPLHVHTHAMHHHHHHEQPAAQAAQPQQQAASDFDAGSFDSSTHAAYGVAGAAHKMMDRAHAAADEVVDNLHHVADRVQRH